MSTVRLLAAGLLILAQPLATSLRATPDAISALSREVGAAKPLTLEMLCVEHDAPLPFTHDPATGVDYALVDGDIYAHSFRAAVRLADDDAGGVLVPLHGDLTCRIRPIANDRHEVTAWIDLKLGGRTELLKTLSMPLDRWMVHTTTTRQTRAIFTRCFGSPKPGRNDRPSLDAMR